MSDTPTTTTTEDEPVLIVGGDPTRDTSNDRFPFRLGATDDKILTATRPKMATILDMVDSLFNEANPVAQASAFNDLLSEVLDDASEKHVRARLRSKDDDLDLDHPDLQAMFKTLLAMWYPQARPTGGRPGSSRPSARTGKRSTARSRSKA